MATSLKEVDLGFLLEEDVPAWKLESRFFPSKVGGKPAWLAFDKTPPLEKLLCGRCSSPMTFLLQIYAPVDTGRRPAVSNIFEPDDEGFHRSLFVFLCKNPKCCVDNQKCNNLVVFRSQLPRTNPYYSYEPPDEEDPEAEPGTRISDHHGVCWVCGVVVDGKKCAACGKAVYCSKEHQKLDWKAGHKQQCGDEDEPSERKYEKPFLFPEKEIEMDMEELDEEEESSGDEDESGQKSSKKKPVNDPELAEKIKNMTEGSAQFNVSELLAMAKGDEDEDPVCEKFLRTVRKNPKQIVRYQRGGDPLWVSSEGQPGENDVPPCELCGEKRIFEFQIMPQLLTHLKLDDKGESVDWGTIAVYTCQRSCVPDEYAQEFAWKQDFVGQ